MKKIVILLFCFGVGFCNVSAQEKTIDSVNNSSLALNFEGGFAEMKYGSLKASANVLGVSINKEYEGVFNDHLLLDVGLSNHLTFGNFTYDAKNVYLSTSSISLPVSVVILPEISGPNKIYAKLGIYGSYLYNVDITTDVDDFFIPEDNTGFNFGGIFELGLVTYISKNLSFKSGFKMISDFASSFKDEKIKVTTSAYLIDIGILIRF